MTETMYISEDFKAYERVMMELKELEQKAEEMKTHLTLYMAQQGIDETSMLPEGGKIQLQYKGTWKYTGVIEQAEKAIADAKKKEQLQGVAIETKNPFIKYVSPSKKGRKKVK